MHFSVFCLESFFASLIDPKHYHYPSKYVYKFYWKSLYHVNSKLISYFPMVLNTFDFHFSNHTLIHSNTSIIDDIIIILVFLVFDTSNYVFFALIVLIILGSFYMGPWVFSFVYSQRLYFLSIKTARDHNSFLKQLQQ